MSFPPQVVQYPTHPKPTNYPTISQLLQLPNLIQIQTKSYHSFLKQPLLQIFPHISPIQHFTRNLSLQFVDYPLGEPKYHLQQSKNPHPTYPPPLPLKVRLIIKETREVKEQQVF
ncbi:hypothetical protein, partial [Staphylococcus haemolyticus]|uniref:hypothetical protein n=1 Tax=Staphylococcus haemolyticus TaxID=1283 RepID=UPI0021B3DC60